MILAPFSYCSIENRTLHQHKCDIIQFCDTHYAGCKEVTQDHINQLKVDTPMNGVEEEDAPKHVQQDEGQTGHSRGNKEVLGIMEEADGAGASHVSQDVDQGERTGDDAKPEARHCIICSVNLVQYKDS